MLKDHQTATGVRNDAFWGLADQGVVSIGNLLINLSLIRLATKEEYGIYLLCFGALNLMLSLNSALLTIPMTVLANQQRNAGKVKAYCGALLRTQLIVCLATGLTCSSALYATLRWICAGDTQTGLALAMFLSILGVLLQDFLRRYFFLRFKPLRAFSLDLTVMFANLLILGLVALQDLPDKHIWALAALGIATLVSSLFTLYATGLLRIHSTSTDAFRACWEHGRWSSIGAIITWLQNQSYVLFLSVSVGLASLAEANAARLLLSPINLANTGVSAVLLPRLSRATAKENDREAESLANVALSILIVALLSFTIVVWLLKNDLVPWMFGDDYSEISAFIVAWAAVGLVTLVRANRTNLLMARSAFRALAIANVASCTLVFATAPILLHMLGALGSVCALGVAETALAVLLWMLARKTTPHLTQQKPTNTAE